MSSGGGAAALLQLGITAIERTVPSGLAAVRRWLRSKKVVVVGQSRAGKSTFIDYLHFGFFGDEKDTRKTHAPERTAQFTLEVGKDKTLQVTLQTVVELPGQYGAVAHANMVFSERPHGIVVFTDLTTPLEGEGDRAAGGWLTDFCTQLMI